LVCPFRPETNLITFSIFLNLKVNTGNYNFIYIKYTVFS
jgi:hypothetical protein